MTKRNSRKGFRVPRRTALLNFEGTDFDGAEAKCLFDVPLEVVFDFQRLMIREDADSQEEALRNFGENILTEWNLEGDDGKAIPPTAEGVMQLSASLAITMVRAWMGAVQEADPKASAPSPDGDTSAAE